MFFSSKIKCPQCGSKNEVSATNCHYCYTLLIPEAPHEEHEKPNRFENSDFKKSNSKDFNSHSTYERLKYAIKSGKTHKKSLTDFIPTKVLNFAVFFIVFSLLPNAIFLMGSLQVPHRFPEPMIFETYFRIAIILIIYAFDTKGKLAEKPLNFVLLFSVGTFLKPFIAPLTYVNSAGMPVELNITSEAHLKFLIPSAITLLIVFSIFKRRKKKS